MHKRFCDEDASMEIRANWIFCKVARQGSFAYYFVRVRANLGWGGIRCSGVNN